MRVLPAIVRLDRDLTFQSINAYQHDRKRTWRYHIRRDQQPVARLIGPPLLDHGLPVSRPRPDRCCFQNFQYAVKKRVGMYKEPHQSPSKRGLLRFVGSWIRRHFPFNIDLSGWWKIEPWLDSTNYTAREKDDLRALHRKYCLKHRLPPEAFALHVMKRASPQGLGNRSSRCKSFIKDESYDTFKAPRMINPRSKLITLAMGPLIKRLESIIYDLPMVPGQQPDLCWFIKHVPGPERAAQVEKLRQFMVPGAEVVSTDHTAFESHFSPDIMSAVEFQAYRFAVRQDVRASAVINEFERICTGLNVSDCAFFHSAIHGTRQSGDTTTSLGNGFTNLMLVLFTADRKSVV